DLELETVFHYEDHTKMRANGVGARKKFLHVFRFGIRGDVEVFRRLAADDIAYASPREVRNMSAFPQTGNNFTRGFFHRRSFHRMRTVHRTVHLSCERRRLRSIAPAFRRAFTLPK